MLDETTTLVTSTEAQALLRRSAPTLARLVRSGRLTAVWLDGRTRVFSRAEIEALRAELADR